jgi:hypothetical protein
MESVAHELPVHSISTTSVNNSIENHIQSEIDSMSTIITYDCNFIVESLRHITSISSIVIFMRIYNVHVK